MNIKTTRKCLRLFSLYLSFTLISILLTGCSSDQDGQKNNKASQKPRLETQVEVVIPQKHPILQSMMISGRIDNRRRVEIRNPVAGQLTSFNLAEGDAIAANHIIAVVKNPVTHSRLNKAKYQLRQAKNNLSRLESLSKSQAVSEEQLTTAQTEMDVARATVNEIEVEITQGTIKAPFDGIVAQKAVENGTYLSPYTVIATIVDANNFAVTASVPSYQIKPLKQGLSAKVISAGGGETPVATLDRIFPTITGNDNMATVEFLLPKKESNSLTSGERVYLELELPKVEAITIPLRCVRADESGSYLFIVNSQNTIEYRQIKTGTLIDDGIVVTQGLVGGEAVVVTGFSMIKAGSKVVISSSKPL